MIETDLVLYNNAGDRIAVLVEATNISYGFGDSDFLPLTFEYNYNDINPALRDNLIYGNEVRVERNGLVVWAGEIQKITKKATVAGVERLKTVSFVCRHWGEVFLSTRFVTATYNTLDESVIATNIISFINNDTKGGSLTLAQASTGIVVDSASLSGNIRTRIYDKSQALKSLQQLVEVRDTTGTQRYRGFRVSPDFTHNTLRRFFYEPSYGSQITAFEITNPVIDNITLREPDMKDYYNGVFAQGKELEEFVLTGDQSELNRFKYREGYYSAYNVTDTNTLIEVGTQQLTRTINKSPLYEVDLVANNPYTGLFSVGDTIRFVFSDEDLGIDLNEFFRIVEIKINVDDMRVETTSIKIAQSRPLDNVLEGGLEKLITQTKGNSTNLIDLNKA